MQSVKVPPLSIAILIFSEGILGDNEVERYTGEVVSGDGRR